MDVKSTLEKQKKRRETEIAVRRSERNPFLKFKPRSRSEIETEFERLELLIEAIEAESAQLEKKIVCSLLSFAGTESKGLVVRWYNWALKCHEDEELTLWLQMLAGSLGKIACKKLAGGRAVKHLRSLKNKIEPKLLALFPVEKAELIDLHQLSLQDLSNDKPPKRPIGDRPRRLDPILHYDWIAWEEHVYKVAKGASKAAGKGWGDHKTDLVEAGVTSKKEFDALHKRKRDESRRK